MHKKNATVFSEGSAVQSAFVKMKKIFKKLKNITDGLFLKSTSSNKKEIIAKLCCVFFAIVLWLTVVGQTNDIEHEMTYYSVPVTVSNAISLSENSGLSIISGYDYSINITVRGSRAKLSTYTSEDIIASVDVSQITEAGDYSLAVKVSCPPSSGFTVVSQSLDSINVSVDKLTSVELDVEVNIVNAQYNTEAYALGTPTVSPEKVTVKGPQKVLDSISAACVNLDLGNIDSTIGFNNRVLLLDTNDEEIASPYISLSDQYAEGTVPFISVEEATKIIEKSVPLVCSFKYGYYNSSNCIVKIQPEYVTLSGHEKVLSKIQAIDIFTIDETKMTYSTAFEAEIDVPDGTSLVSGPKKADVTVTISDAISNSSVPMSEVSFIGEKVASLEQAYLLCFRGNADILRRFTEDDEAFSVSVDISGIIDSGTYRLPVIVDISSSYNGVWCDYAEVYVNIE